MPDQESILEKVRKLLALSRGSPNAGEAESAMAIAQKLLLEHDLSLEEAEASDTDRSFEEEEVYRGGEIAMEEDYVWALVKQFFFCEPVIDERSPFAKSILLIGRPEHLAVGKYVGVYLRRTYRALWSVYHRERRVPVRAKRSYFEGLTLGIAARLLDERKQQTANRPEAGALIQRQNAAVEAHMLDRFGPLRERPIEKCRIDESAMIDGFERGRDVGIRTPLPSFHDPERLTEE